MAQSVVVLSSQLITTLSVLAYLRWRGIRGTRLEVVSLYRDDLSHSAKAFQPLLQDLAAQDGHDCRFITGDSALIEPEPRACSLLLLPRLDDREGQQMLRAYLASEVVELGELIGGKHVCIQSKPSATGSGRSSWCVVPKPWLRSVWTRWSRCGSRNLSLIHI